jgi:hypothetical protein
MVYREPVIRVLHNRSVPKRIELRERALASRANLQNRFGDPCGSIVGGWSGDCKMGNHFFRHAGRQDSFVAWGLPAT